MTKLELMTKQAKCWGCNVGWAVYGITAETAFSDGKHLYCNGDCHDEAECNRREVEDYLYLSDDFDC